jgi:hypothetical protein
MGLDIRVLTHMAFVEKIDDVLLENESEILLQNQSFAPHSVGMRDGYYSFTLDHSFRAGSYSGYGAWRGRLCELMLGVSQSSVWNTFKYYKGKPFVELINFSDCEGYLSTTICKKLSQDFEDNRDKLPDDEDFVTRYNLWAKGLKTAADNNGVLSFS